MRNLKTTVIVSFFASAMFLFGCKKFEDIRVVDNIAYDAEFAIPLLNSKISLQDMLDNEDDISELEIDENGNMTLIYDAEFEHNSVNELIGEIPSFPIILLDTNTTVPIVVFNNLDVNSVSLKSGTLKFNIQSGIAENINLTITIPQLTKNGIPFSTNLQITYFGSLPVIAVIAPVSIEGYTLDLASNSVQINYEAVTDSGDRVVLDLIAGSADNWDYDLIQGVITQQTFNISEDSIEIDLYGNWLDGNISFEDPRIVIQIENSFGFPGAVKLKNVVAITAAGNEVSLTTTDNSFDIEYPAINEFGESKTTTFYFDKNNSNIREILNTQPTKLIYEIEGILNPDHTNDLGFFTDQSALTSLLTLELPIYGTASSFTVETSTDIDLQDIENISDAEFKIITDNGLPIDVDLQLYFRDKNENIIDSLFNEPQPLLTSASVDVNGNTTNSTETTTFVEFSKDRMLNIQNAKTVLINTSFSTFNNGNTSVIINSSQDIEIRMGAKIGLEN